MKTFSTTLFPRLGLALVLLAPACVSVKPSLKATPSAAIANRLPAAEITADQGPLVMNDGALPEDALDIFKRECKTNLLEPTDTAHYGYLRFAIKDVRTTRTGRGLQALQFVTFFIPSILGIPLEWYQTNLKAEVQVLDANGNILGVYKGTGSSRVKVAMYHGYSQSDAPRLADIIAMRGALAEIRPQLDTAAVRLRPLILNGGTLENPNFSNSLQPDRQ